MPHYQQLQDEERFYIWQARREGKTQQHIADALGRHAATISRELRRNTYAQCHMYTYCWARYIVKHRKASTNQQKARKRTDELAPLIEQLIRQYLSPEQVSGYLKNTMLSASVMKPSIASSTVM
jgi:IS30 family transposase